jgi:NAD(P)H dehydrogenase (quinone)
VIMSRLLVIDGHPDSKSLTHELSAAYQAGAEPHLEVARLALRELRFDPILHHGYAKPQALEPDLQRAQAAIKAAQHVAWFFPCWWNAPPALVKGFLDRVLLPGFAFRFVEGKALQEKLLAGRSARFVTSMDSPRFWHWLVNRSALQVQFKRSTLGFCGFSPVRGDTFYSARTLTKEARARAMEKMRKAGAKDALRALATPRSGAEASAAAA